MQSFISTLRRGLHSWEAWSAISVAAGASIALTDGNLRLGFVVGTFVAAVIAGLLKAGTPAKPKEGEK